MFIIKEKILHPENKKFYRMVKLTDSEEASINNINGVLDKASIELCINCPSNTVALIDSKNWQALWLSNNIPDMSVRYNIMYDNYTGRTKVGYTKSFLNACKYIGSDDGDYEMYSFEKDE